MWFNPITTWLIRSPLHGMVSKNMMLISYKGRRSGQQYTTPVNYLDVSDNGVAVLYTTSYRDRVWWRNLRGGAAVTLRLHGRDLPAQAQVIEGQELVEEALDAYLRKAPHLARYFDINLREDGIPNKDDVRLAAEKMVVVKTIVDSLVRG